jgi:hypothetical protein
MRILQDEFSKESPFAAERKWIQYFHRLGAELKNTQI